MKWLPFTSKTEPAQQPEMPQISRMLGLRDKSPAGQAARTARAKAHTIEKNRQAAQVAEAAAEAEQKAHAQFVANGISASKKHDADIARALVRHRERLVLRERILHEDSLAYFDSLRSEDQLTKMDLVNHFNDNHTLHQDKTIERAPTLLNRATDTEN